MTRKAANEGWLIVAAIIVVGVIAGAVIVKQHETPEPYVPTPEEKAIARERETRERAREREASRERERLEQLEFAKWRERHEWFYDTLEKCRADRKRFAQLSRKDREAFLDAMTEEQQMWSSGRVKSQYNTAFISRDLARELRSFRQEHDRVTADELARGVK